MYAELNFSVLYMPTKFFPLSSIFLSYVLTLVLVFHFMRLGHALDLYMITGGFLRIFDPMLSLGKLKERDPFDLKSVP